MCAEWHHRRWMGQQRDPESWTSDFAVQNIVFPTYPHTGFFIKMWVPYDLALLYLLHHISCVSPPFLSSFYAPIIHIHTPLFPYVWLFLCGLGQTIKANQHKKTQENSVALSCGAYYNVITYNLGYFVSLNYIFLTVYPPNFVTVFFYFSKPFGDYFRKASSCPIITNDTSTSNNNNDNNN